MMSWEGPGDQFREASEKKSLQLMIAITMTLIKPQRSLLKPLHSLQRFHFTAK